MHLVFAGQEMPALREARSSATKREAKREAIQGGIDRNLCPAFICCMREAVIFDTEFTSWPGAMQRNWSNPGEFKEIVQIGAIRTDIEELVEAESFSTLIRPIRNPVLSDYFVTLTGITQGAVDATGVTLLDGTRAFLNFARGAPLFCYGRDDRICTENAALIGIGKDWPAFAAYDITFWFKSVGIDLKGVGSGQVAAHVGAPHSEAAHQGIADSRSILSAIRFLVAKGAPSPFQAPYLWAGPG